MLITKLLSKHPPRPFLHYSTQIYLALAVSALILSVTAIYSGLFHHTGHLIASFKIAIGVTILFAGSYALLHFRRRISFTRPSTSEPHPHPDPQAQEPSS